MEKMIENERLQECMRIIVKTPPKLRYTRWLTTLHLEIFVDMEIFYAGRMWIHGYMHSVIYTTHITTYAKYYVNHMLIIVCRCVI